MANEPKFTPGPWIWEPEFLGLYGAGKDNAVLDYAAYEGMWVRDWMPEGTANAHLIAAAPDMYEALGLHVEYEAIPQDRGGKTGPKGRAWAGFIAARDAALAKARGE